MKRDKNAIKRPTPHKVNTLDYGNRFYLVSGICLCVFDNAGDWN